MKDAAQPAITDQRPGGLPAAPDYGTVLAEAERVLDAVEGALARLDDGTYGSCEVCGATIGDEILATMPTARTCDAHLPLADRR